MIETDYPIEALALLLREDCLPERYHPLISRREELIAGLRRLGCRRKNEAVALPDGVLSPFVSGEGELRLLRRFFTLYDPDPRKFRELEKLALDPDEREVYGELYHLPGVKQVRAALYCRAGYRSLAAIAGASAGEILRATAETIEREGLSCARPLPKEVRTHIAVARAFTGK